MSDPQQPKTRSVYYDAVIKLLDSAVKPELHSTRGLYAYNFIRRELARFATLNDNDSLLPENLAALHPDATPHPEDTLSGEALRAALAHEGGLLDEIEAATEARLTPRSSDSGETSLSLPRSLNAESMTDYLRAKLDPAITVRKLNVLAGGRSKQTIMMTLADASGGEVERVIRRDMATSPTGSSAADEFALLRMLSDAGVPVPRPILCEADATRFGSPLIIVDKVPGALAGHIFDPPGRERVLDCARALGRLHSLPAVEIAPTLPAQRNTAPDLSELRALVTSMRDLWNERARQPSVTIDVAFDWMLSNIEKLQLSTAVVHGDFSFHNLLFDGNGLSAILDWELARIGHPAEDLGYVRPAVLKRVAWNDFMAAYREGGGPAVDPLEVVFYTLLERMRLLTMMFRARDFVDFGLTDDIEFIDAFVISMPRAVHQVSVEIREVLGIRARQTPQAGIG